MKFWMLIIMRARGTDRGTLSFRPSFLGTSRTAPTEPFLKYPEIVDFREYHNQPKVLGSQIWTYWMIRICYKETVYCDPLKLVLEFWPGFCGAHSSFPFEFVPYRRKTQALKTEDCPPATGLPNPWFKLTNGAKVVLVVVVISVVVFVVVWVIHSRPFEATVWTWFLSHKHFSSLDICPEY